MTKNKNLSQWLLKSVMLLSMISSFQIGSAQVRLDNKSSKTFCLNGYFLLYRKEIDLSENDHKQPLTDYRIFFIKELNASIISDFLLLDSLRADILEVAESWETLNLMAGENSDSVFSIIEKRNPKWNKGIYTAFEFSKDVPQAILNGSNRFIAVYKGLLNTLGPFRTSGNLIRRESSGYLYIQDTINDVEYMYSIVLPLLAEEKKLLYPHAMEKEHTLNLTASYFTY